MIERVGEEHLSEQDRLSDLFETSIPSRSRSIRRAFA
jgi:hypothetical protein